MAGIITDDKIIDFVKSNKVLYWPFPDEEHVIKLGDDLIYLDVYPTIFGFCNREWIQFYVAMSCLTGEGIETRDYILVDKGRTQMNEEKIQENELTLELLDKIAKTTAFSVVMEVGQVEFVKEVDGMVTIRLKKEACERNG
jgi:hypothetical protein